MPHLHLSLKDQSGEARMLEASDLAEEDALALLQTAEITGSQLVPWGSNYTFAVLLTAPDESEHLAIYKPCAGEAPLYDFPDGTLFQREVAAYLLSRELGWGLVPPTVVREGPHGEGSLQLYVAAVEDAEDSDPLRFWRRRSIEIERLVLFDLITNNADRKIGHCLRDSRNRVWGIDHGLTFNEDPKLRTVLWQYAGSPISETLLADLQKVDDEWDRFDALLTPYINRGERLAFRMRASRIVEAREHPILDPRRNVPWGW